MHILALLVGLATAIGVILWRLGNAANAARDIAGAADEIGSFVRRTRFRRAAGRDPLELVDEPRLAAAAMMVATAQSDGALTERERTIILDEIRYTLNAGSDKTAEAMLAHARWLVRDKTDLETVLRKLENVIIAKCGPTERTDVVRMLHSVAHADGPPGDIERIAIERLERRTTNRG